MVLSAQAPERLLDTYDEERSYAADENIMNSTRSTDFITPKSAMSRLFRDAVLDLARHHRFARSLVNSGRLSVPSFLHGSSLNTADAASFSGRMIPGAPMDDAPVSFEGGEGWLLRHVGDCFVVLMYAQTTMPSPELLRQLQAVSVNGVTIRPVVVAEAALARDTAGSLSSIQVHVLTDGKGRFRERYDARQDTVYLIRPDQHVVARWREIDITGIRQALARATCNA